MLPIHRQPIHQLLLLGLQPEARVPPPLLQKEPVAPQPRATFQPGLQVGGRRPLQRELERRPNLFPQRVECRQAGFQLAIQRVPGIPGSVAANVGTEPPRQRLEGFVFPQQRLPAPLPRAIAPQRTERRRLPGRLLQPLLVVDQQRLELGRPNRRVQRTQIPRLRTARCTHNPTPSRPQDRRKRRHQPPATTTPTPSATAATHRCYRSPHHRQPVTPNRPPRPASPRLTACGGRSRSPPGHGRPSRAAAHSPASHCGPGPPAIPAAPRPAGSPPPSATG